DMRPEECEANEKNFFARAQKNPCQESYRYVHTLLEKMQQLFPGYAQFPQDRKCNYVLIAIEMFPAASRIEDFAIDHNGRFQPRQTLRNVRIETIRDDNSLISWNHHGHRAEVSFDYWHKMRHVKERNQMYPLLTSDQGDLLAVEDIILFE
ncbi:hypothetical protein PMAYCL1PPCAC_31834, partial [Pristionchus mayeri]